MNNKLWLLIAGVLSVAVLVMGWFLGVSPKIDEMSAAMEQRANVEQQNRLYEVKLKDLEKQYAQIDELRASLDEAQLGLPPGDELSSFLGQLHKLEVSSGVTLTSFAAGDGERYIGAPGATANPLVTADNLVAITIDLTVTGSLTQVMNFVSNLQYGDRLFLVTKLTVAEDKTVAQTPSGTVAAPGGFTGDITGYVYVLVDPSAPPPTPTPVGSLNSTPSPSPSP